MMEQDRLEQSPHSSLPGRRSTLAVASASSEAPRLADTTDRAFSIGSINLAALNNELINTDPVNAQWSEPSTRAALIKPSPPCPRLPGQQPFDNEVVSSKEYVPHSLVRHEMVPFLPYIEKARKQQSPPRHKKLPENKHDQHKIIRNWLNVCDKYHSNHCFVPVSKAGDLSASAPIWLIDVDMECLVPAPNGAKYMALSYVWGQGASVVSSTTTSNLQKLQEKGSLAREGVDVPKTISQVMKLTSRLQIPFLWVDKFCIVQDDPLKQTQFDSMAAIYTGAYLTVVAAEGDCADDGIQALDDQPDPSHSNDTFGTGLIFGVGKRIPRLLSAIRKKVRISKDSSHFYDGDHIQHLQHLSEEERDRLSSLAGNRNSQEVKRTGFAVLSLRQPFNVETWGHDAIMEWYSTHLVRSKWALRGWTLQEQLFSRRKIVFQNNTVNWECHCACWQEGQGVFEGHNQRSCSSAPTGSLINTARVPDMYRYARLISRYNHRDLTFAADAIDAFAGVLSDLSKVWEGGFISGLPVFCFDAALIWQPWGPIVKRFSESSELPSWSWVGWHCDIHSESLRSAYGYLRANVDEFQNGDWYPSSWHTYPTVDWYYSDTLQSQKHQVQRLMSPTIVRDAQDEIFQPPKGWEKLRCQRSRKFYYREGHSGEGFWYPVPLAAPNQLPLPVNRSRFLHCRTRRTFIPAVRARAPFLHISSACEAIELLSPQSTKAIGVLRLFEEHGKVSYPVGLSELVELSAGSVDNQPTEKDTFDEWERLTDEWSSSESGKYEFYNVMWIERGNDGLCRRRAIGRVVKSAWEELEMDEVDITIA